MNFVAVDWSLGSWQLPMFAVLEADAVAETVTDFIRNLTTIKHVPVKNIHIIGHSMGARVAGKVGTNLSPGVSRITGM